MQEIFRSYEYGVVDAVTALHNFLSKDTQSTVVFNVNAKVFGLGVLPEVEITCNLPICTEDTVFRVRLVTAGVVQRVVEINEEEGASPLVGVE